MVQSSRMRVSLLAVVSPLIASTAALAQPKSTTVACTKELIDKGNTFEVIGATKSANSEVTYSDAADSELKLYLANAMLTVTDSGRVLCSNPIGSFQLGLRMPHAWLKDPANGGALALAMRCANMFDRDKATSTPLSLVVGSTDKLTALDANVSATSFTARAKLDQPSLRFLNCKR